MKYLVVVRHGHDRIGDELTQYGRHAIENLAKHLKQYAQGEIFIVSSQKNRAIASAEIIKQELGGGIQPLGSLNPPEWKFVKYVEEYGKEYDTVVVVCHLDMARTLPSDFAKEVLEKTLPKIPLDYAEACVLNVEGGTQLHLKGN